MGALEDAPPVEDQEELAQEEPAAEEEADEDSPAVSQKFRVKVKNDAGNDEEKDLTLEELAQGYMQHADYTRKTQHAAQAEKLRQEEFQRFTSATAQQAQQHMQALQQMVLAAAAPELSNVDWQRLAYEDPARYVQLQSRQQQIGQVLGNIQAQSQQLQQQQALQARQQFEQAMRHSMDYLSKEIPGFNLEKDSKGLREAAKKYAFTDEEIGSISDGRFVHLLHDAAKWQELQAAKPKALQKVAEAPKVIRPAAPQPKKQNQSAMERLKKTGRASELVNFL